MRHHTFAQATGVFSCVRLTGGNTTFVGYAGDEGHWNEPSAETMVRQGPLHCGFYDIGEPYTHERLGPLVMNLTAWKPLFGRLAFRIHGDNFKMNHTASEGCIVLGPVQRRAIVDSGVRVLAVVRG